MLQGQFRKLLGFYDQLKRMQYNSNYISSITFLIRTPPFRNYFLCSPLTTTHPVSARKTQTNDYRDVQAVARFKIKSLD